MRRIVPLLTLAGILVAGQVAAVAEPDPARISAAKNVEVSNFKFSPGTLTVAKGSRVVFSNTSRTAHTATDKGIFDTGRIKAGKTAAVRFERRGTFRYHCKIHPSMTGRVVVD
jgi:plastocyanin